MKVQMRRRSRLDEAATGAASRTLPGERRVLTVVLSARVVPRKSEGVDVTQHGGRAPVGDEADRPVAFSHRFGREAEHDEAESVEGDGAVLPPLDLESHRERAGFLRRLDGHQAGQAGTHEVTAARFVVLPFDVPGSRSHPVSPRYG